MNRLLETITLTFLAIAFVRGFPFDHGAENGESDRISYQYGRKRTV